MNPSRHAGEAAVRCRQAGCSSRRRHQGAHARCRAPRGRVSALHAMLPTAPVNLSSPTRSASTADSPANIFFSAAYMLTCMLAVPCGFTQVRPWLYSIEAKRRRDHAHAWCRPYPRLSSTSVGQRDVGWRGHASLVLHVRSQHVWIRAAVQHRLLSTRWVLRALRAMRLALSAEQVL